MDKLITDWQNLLPEDLRAKVITSQGEIRLGANYFRRPSDAVGWEGCHGKNYEKGDWTRLSVSNTACWLGTALYGWGIPPNQNNLWVKNEFVRSADKHSKIRDNNPARHFFNEARVGRGIFLAIPDETEDVRYLGFFPGDEITWTGSSMKVTRDSYSSMVPPAEYAFYANLFQERWESYVMPGMHAPLAFPEPLAEDSPYFCNQSQVAPRTPA